MKKDLRQLLEDVDALFPQNAGSYGVIFYGLHRFKGSWAFDVTTSWSQWLKQGYDYRFVAYSPEEAVEAFLSYVQRNEIDVASLMAD